MKEIVKVLLQEGLSEEVIHEVLDIIEAWSGTSASKHDYENPENKEIHGYTSKRVEMTPDEYINKSAKLFRRKGYPKSIKVASKEIVTSREGHKWDQNTSMIDHYAQELQNPNSKVNEPYLFYNHKGDSTHDQQDGLHRAIAAKKLGHKTIPVHIFHSNTKKDPATKKAKRVERKEQNKKSGELRKEQAKLHKLTDESKKRS